MSGVRLTYKLDATPASLFFKRLDNFQSRGMFDDIGGYLDSEVHNRFAEGKDPDGNGWWPSQRALNEGGSTLVDHGLLRDTITHLAFLDGSGVEHGSNVIYAAIHQFGGDAGRNLAVSIPARPFIGINGDDEDVIDNIVEDHLRMAMQ